MSSHQIYAFADGLASLRRNRARFFIAVGSIVLALLGTTAIEDLFRSAAAGLFVLAVCLCTALFGLLPGLCSAAVAAVVVDFFYIPPQHTLDPSLFRTALVLGGLAGFSEFAKVQISKRVRRRAGMPPLASMEESSIVPPALGALDGMRDGELFGWGFNPVHPALPELVTIYINHRPITTVAPVHHRQDVADALGCPRHVGFYVDLRKHACVEAGQSVLVDARFPNGTSLVNSPMTVQVPAVIPRQHRRTVLFMHIPKTAGTAFREFIASNFLHSEIAYIYPTPPGFPVSDLHSLPLDQRRAYRVVIGHYQFGVHESLPQESEYITIVREPAARTISQYAYLHQTQPEVLRNGRGGAVMALRELLEGRLTADFDNPMVRCFSGIGEGDLPPGTITSDVVDRALNNLQDSFAYVGHQEESEQAFEQLRQRYGWDARDALCSVNRSQVIVPERTADKATTDAIRHVNRWDYLLYAEVLKLFPHKRASAFSR